MMLMCNATNGSVVLKSQDHMFLRCEALGISGLGILLSQGICLQLTYCFQVENEYLNI